jgi:GT2 family glycosyltransferase
MVDVSIIIVAWNVQELLYNCLKSVYEQTNGIAFEVIYVDNASSDDSVEMVSKEFPEVKIIENEDNKGFIKANNQGIEISQGRYVLLLNSDTIVLDNAIAKTVKFADEHAEAAVVGCKILNPDQTLQRGTCFMYPSALNMFLFATYLYKIFPKSKFFGREKMSWWDYDDVREVDAVCGCFSLVRKEAIEQVGLMNEIYYVYGDDPDWCYRFRQKGWKVMFNPKAEIIHYGGQTTNQMADRFKLQLYGSKLIFMKLYRSKCMFLLASVFTAMFFLVRIPYWLAASVFGKNDKGKSFQIVKNYLLGFVYCLTNWKKLLMNRKEVEGKL